MTGWNGWLKGACVGVPLAVLVLSAPAVGGEPAADGSGVGDGQAAAVAAVSDVPQPVAAPQARPDFAEGAVTIASPSLKRALELLGSGASEEERKEIAAIKGHYNAKEYTPLWHAGGALTDKGQALLREIRQADDWGLDAAELAAELEPRGRSSTLGEAEREAAIAEADVALTATALKYARYARGGRILVPSEQLSSYLDRRPQLLDPAVVMAALAGAEKPDAYLRSLHPQHAQFELLRKKYLEARPIASRSEARKGRKGSEEARRILANMEQWRWMPAELGSFYVWNNIPEFMQRVVRDGEIIHTERIVAGELSKQTPIFSRPLRRVTFKPTWKVPESIKVRELWPSLLKGGGLMQTWGLEVQTKDGQTVDWRRMDWTKTDIREYDVVQLHSRKNVLGRVKFSFPNPHTVFMHDTLERDKYMFNVGQRTFSHGCMRVRNPMRLAEVLLAQDKGWDVARVNEAFDNGPNNNEIALDRWVPVHVTYFTALVGEDGKLQTFRDIYGHERRILQALDGKWEQISKGRDHLAPVELDLASAASRVKPRGEGVDADGSVTAMAQPRGGPRYQKKDTGGSFLSSLLGL